MRNVRSHITACAAQRDRNGGRGHYRFKPRAQQSRATDREGSGGDLLTFHLACSTRRCAVLALGMHVLAALGLTALAYIETDTGHFGKTGSALGGEGPYGSANRQHFVYGFGAGGHRLVTGPEQFQAMAQANFSLADTFAVSVQQRFVDNPG